MKVIKSIINAFAGKKSTTMEQEGATEKEQKKEEKIHIAGETHKEKQEIANKEFAQLHKEEGVKQEEKKEEVPNSSFAKVHGTAEAKTEVVKEPNLNHLADIHAPKEEKKEEPKEAE